MREYGFKSICKTNKRYIEMLANSFVDEWNAAFNEPAVLNGEIDALDYPTVVAWGILLDAQGYRMQYDADNECFWLINNHDSTDIGIFYY